MEAVPGGGFSVPSLVDALCNAIRGRILTGELQGGTRLTEAEVASHYDVARPTAKASIERLVHDGLLRRATNKTASVPVLRAEDIRDLYFGRSMLEREVLTLLARQRLVPEASRQHLKALREIGDDPNVIQVVEVDVAFHRSLVEALGSPRISRFYNSLIGELHLCMAQVQEHNLLSPLEIASEHEAIAKAIEAGSVRRVVAEIDEHLDRACSRLLGYVEQRDAASLSERRDGP